MKAPLSGWLVVNGFLKSAKFDEIYRLLVDAFGSRGISLRIRTNDTLLAVIRHKAENPPDFVLFWDKDVSLARHLENAGLRLFNPSRGIEVCDDKGETALALEGGGVAMPKTILAPLTFDNIGYHSFRFLDSVIAQLGFPMIVKARKGSFGREVFLARDRNSLRGAVERGLSAGLMFQEFIASSFGRDVRVQTLGGRVVATVLRQGALDDFRSNVTAGGTMTPWMPPEPFVRAALEVTARLGLDFAGVDLLFGRDGEPVLCEVNSNPHFKNLLDATGVNFAESLADYVMNVTGGRP